MSMAPPPTDPVAYQSWLEESLHSEDAADFLGVTRNWLERKRCDGTGPIFRALSTRMITYVRRDLLNFRNSKQFTSTSEYGTQRGDSPSPSIPAEGGDS